MSLLTADMSTIASVESDPCGFITLAFLFISIFPFNLHFMQLINTKRPCRCFFVLFLKRIYSYMLLWKFVFTFDSQELKHEQTFHYAYCRFSSAVNEDGANMNLSQGNLPLAKGRCSSFIFYTKTKLSLSWGYKMSYPSFRADYSQINFFSRKR